MLKCSVTGESSDYSCFEAHCFVYGLMKPTLLNTASCDRARKSFVFLTCLKAMRVPARGLSPGPQHLSKHWACKPIPKHARLLMAGSKLFRSTLGNPLRCTSCACIYVCRFVVLLGGACASPIGELSYGLTGFELFGDCREPHFICECSSLDPDCCPRNLLVDSRYRMLLVPDWLLHVSRLTPCRLHCSDNKHLKISAAIVPKVT